jgi:PAS domain S-box-containing protein
VNGNVIDVNREFARIVDRNRTKIGDANVFSWTHPEDHPRHQAFLRQLLAGEIPSFVIEKRYIRPDGSIVWVRNSVSLMGDEDTQSGRLLSICEDISDRKLAE